MKTLCREIVTAFLMGAVVPGIMLNTAVFIQNGRAAELAAVETTQASAQEREAMVIHLQYPDGSIRPIEMDDYLTGVLLGEMPADFEMEALKAQAVAARTYTARALQDGEKHGRADICTDHTCCQAYFSPDEYLTAGGSEEDLEKMHTAVTDTSGLVLTYEGALIEATYFSCSGGSTEDAKAVWGTDYPYLQAVSSLGEEASAHYRDTLYFSSEEIRNRLGRDLPGKPDAWFGTLKRTRGGGVETLEICDEAYTGTSLRSLLNLPSTAFSLRVDGDTIVISSRGYGHRVGMSQYGADAMAAGGSDYSEILAHYYPGTTLEMLE